MAAQIYPVPGDRMLGRLLSPGSPLGSDRRQPEHVERGNWVSVLAGWMGTLVLAAVCVAVRQAVHLYLLSDRGCGKSPQP